MFEAAGIRCETISPRDMVSASLGDEETSFPGTAAGAVPSQRRDDELPWPRASRRRRRPDLAHLVRKEQLPGNEETAFPATGPGAAVSVIKNSQGGFCNQLQKYQRAIDSVERELCKIKYIGMPNVY